MGWKLRLLVVFVLSVGLVAAIGTGTRAQNAPAPKAEVNSHQFKDMLAEFSAKTGRVVLIDKGTSDSVGNLQTIAPAGEDLDVETRLRESLAQARLTLSLDGTTYRVIPVAHAATKAPIVELADLHKHHRLEWVSCVIQLSTIDANIARTSVAPFMTREGVVSPLQFGNCMVVVDSATQVQRIADMLKSFDEKARRARSVFSAALPDGLDPEELTRAVKQVAGLSGYATADGKRFLFASDPDNAEDVRTRILKIASTMKGE